MLTGLQWTHLIPTEYVEGPVLAVHFPHSGAFTSQVRFPHTTVFNSLTLAGRGNMPSCSTSSGNRNGHHTAMLALFLESYKAKEP